MFRTNFALSARPAGALALTVTFFVTFGLVGTPAHAAEATVGLGSAGSFAVLAGESVTNTGPSVITGDLGVSPGSSVTGLPPLLVLDGAPHVADAVANLAQADLTTAYDSAAGRPTVTDVTGQDLGGMTLTSGVVEHTSGMQLTGTVTLDAQGDPSAVFIFKAGSTLVTAPNSTVSLINGASPCNVFWQVGSSATLDTNTTFVGTIMALTSATLRTATTVQGRVLARTGSVTLDTNVITRPGCAAAAAPSGSAAPTVTPTASPSTASATTSPSPSQGSTSGAGGGNNGNNGNNNGGGNNGGGGNSNGSGTGVPGGGETGGPVVPVGHPETGMATSDSSPVPAGWVLLWLLGGTAVLGAAYARRRTSPVRLH